MTRYNIKVFPHGRQFKATAGANLLTHLVEHSILLRTDCGGRGICGKCQVDISTNEGHVIKENACSVEIDRDITVEIPPTSLLSSHIIEKAPATLPDSFYTTNRTQTCPDPRYGIAVDLGTTTIALYLCDISSRVVLASLSVKNPQAIYGDDVMSRIGAVSTEVGNLQHLQKLAVNSIEWGAVELAKVHDIPPRQLERMVVVGNPTMIHLFLGINPQSIGVAPYQPAFFNSQSIESSQLHFQQLQLNVLTLPQISGFIGGDILAAALAAEIENQQAGTLIVDIGTNGELIYKGLHGIYATSCATGPAFEGAAISCGMQAIPGAIEKVIISDKYRRPQHVVIQNNETTPAPSPTGLCGSGVISLAAELRRTGIVEKSGAFIVDDGIEALSQVTGHSKNYSITDTTSNGNSVEVVISQKDIRSIQLGKAALFTGIDFLLNMEQRTVPEKIIVAGAFGSYLEKEDMLTLGMLPKVEPKRIYSSGNLAGAGAVMVLCDPNYLEQARKLAATITVIDLAADVDFQNHFLNNLAFPELI